MAGSKPLQDQRLLVTRPPEEQDAAADVIRAWGGVPIACPTIRIAPPDDWTAFDNAMRCLDQLDWIIFTSANAVRSFADRIKQLSLETTNVSLFSKQIDAAFTQLDLAQFPRLAALGPGVEAAMLEHGLRPDFLAAQANAQAFSEEFLAMYDVKEMRVLLPLSDIARRTLPEALASAGARIQEVIAYRNLPAERLSQDAEVALVRGKIDWALFFSPSTARSFFRLAPPRVLASRRFRIASIGPTTSEALYELGYSPDVEADPHTLKGLLKAIQQWLVDGG